jgi:hypothetical protein
MPDQKPIPAAPASNDSFHWDTQPAPDGTAPVKPATQGAPGTATATSNIPTQSQFIEEFDKTHPVGTAYTAPMSAPDFITSAAGKVSSEFSALKSTDDFESLLQLQARSPLNDVAPKAESYYNQFGGITTVTPKGEILEANLTEAQTKDIEGYQKEFEAAGKIPTWEELKGKTVATGTIIKVDDSFRKGSSTWNSKLLADNQNKDGSYSWDGEYLQMRFDEKAGKVLPMPYEPFKKLADAGKSVGELPDAEVTGIAPTLTPAQSQKWIDAQVGKESEFERSEAGGDLAMNNPQLFDYPVSNRLKDVFNSAPRLAGLLSKEPKLYEAFKNRIAGLGGDQVVDQNEQHRVLQESIAEVFSLNQEVSPDVRMAADASSRLSSIAQQYGKQQRDLAAQMKLSIGEQPEALELAALETKMAIDPRNVTSSDTERYENLNREVSHRIVETGKGTKEWEQYIANRASYATALKGVAKSINVFSDPEKQEELQTYLSQSRGKDLINHTSEYFPKVKEAEAKQGQLDSSGDGWSSVKGLVGGAAQGTYNAALYFLSDKGKSMLGNILTSGTAPDKDAVFLTPNRPTQNADGTPNYLNGLLNSLDGGTKMLGNMIPAMTAGVAGGAPMELLAFGAMSAQEARSEGIRQGLKPNEADTYGMINGMVTAAAMRLQLPGSLLRGGESLENLIADGFSHKGVYDYAKKLLIPTTADMSHIAIATAQAAAMDIANSVVNSGYNKVKGTKFETLEPDKLMKSMASMGAMAYLFTRVGKISEMGNARPLLFKAFNEAPQQTLDALDMARKRLLVEAGSGDPKAAYALTQVTKAHELLSEYAKNQSGLLPAETQEQHIAQAMVVGDIAELKARRAKALPELHSVLESKIETKQKELHEVVNSPEKAAKVVGKSLEPIQEMQDASNPPTGPKIFTDLDHTLVTSDTDNTLTPWGEELKAKIKSGEVNPADVHIVSHTDSEARAHEIAKKLGIPAENVKTGLRTPEEKSQYIASRGGKEGDVFVDDRSENRAAVEKNVEGVKTQDPNADPRLAKLDNKIATTKEAGERRHYEKQKELITKYGMDSDEIRKKLEDEGKLKVKCPPGAKKRVSLRGLFKAAAGLVTGANVVKSEGKWEIMGEIQGDSHAGGGVDIKVKGKAVNAEGDELRIKHSDGTEAIIPKDQADHVQGLIRDSKHSEVSKLVSELPKMPSKAEDGGKYPEPPNYKPLTVDQRTDWNNFLNYLDSKGVSGNKVLDARDKTLGLQYLDEYKKLNPKSTLSAETIPVVQYDQYMLRKGDRFGNFTSDELKGWRESNKDFVNKPVSNVDSWLGSVTSKLYYPSASRVFNDGRPKQDFGTDIETYYRTGKAMDAIVKK